MIYIIIQFSSFEGQKQDSFGGSFGGGESFVGELTQFTIFNKVLPDDDIAAMASVESGKCKHTHQGNIMSWTDVLDDAHHGNVTIRNASWCMGKNTQWFALELKTF